MRKGYFIFALTLSALVSLFCGVLLWHEYGIFALIAYAGIIACFPLSFVLHELGHVLFGTICKIKVKPHFSLFKSDRCTILPKSEKHLKARVAVTSLGGLIINQILGVLGFLAMTGFVPVWLCVLFPANLYILEINFTLSNGAQKTDFEVFLYLVNGSDEGKVMLAVLKIQAQLYAGKPIEEVDEELLFKVPQIREDDESFIALTELRYEYVKAKSGEEAAKPYKDRLDYLKEYLP